MSSAMDDTAGYRPNTTHSRSKRSGIRHGVVLNQTTPLLLMPFEDQAATNTVDPPSPRRDPADGTYDFAHPGYQYQLMTPPTDTLDAPPDSSSDQILQPYYGKYVQSSQAIESDRILSTPPTGVTSLPLSRDHQNWGPPQSCKDRTSTSHTQWLLPSPPTSPPNIIVEVPPDFTKPGKLTTSRPGKQPHDVSYRAFSGPMLQTSTVPPRWSTNCTVLKADTSIDVGNVTSPTCMIGLPFGGMTEMTLPLPPGEIKGISCDD
jgi:hypothetical protein